MAVITHPYDWTLYLERPGKKIWRRYNLADDAVEYLEEFFEDVPLKAAEQLREIHPNNKNCKPLSVIPPSVLNRALREGWANDDDRWIKWMNDGDNKYLRITEGAV